MGFHIPKIWQIMKPFTRSFHQAHTSYFWRVIDYTYHSIPNRNSFQQYIKSKVSIQWTFYTFQKDLYMLQLQEQTILSFLITPSLVWPPRGSVMTLRIKKKCILTTRAISLMQIKLLYKLCQSTSMTFWFLSIKIVIKQN